MASNELATVAGTQFVANSRLIQSLLEDATAAALTTALATLPYAPSDATRWIALLNGLQAPPASALFPRNHLFALYLGSSHPTLDALSAAELAGCWHISHYLDTPSHHCFAVEETLLQRFAAGEMGLLEGSAPKGAGSGEAEGGAAAGSKRKRDDLPTDFWEAALSSAPGELWERLERRWLELLADAPGPATIYDPASPDFVERNHFFLDGYADVSALAPSRFGAAARNQNLWDCARGAVPSSSLQQRVVATLFGHPANLASLGVPFPGAYGTLLGAAAMGGHVSTLRTLPVATVKRYLSDICTGMMLQRGGQHGAGKWLKSNQATVTSTTAIACMSIGAALGDTPALMWYLDTFSLNQTKSTGHPQGSQKCGRPPGSTHILAQSTGC